MVTIPELSQDAAQLQQRIERFHAVRDGILAQVRQVIVGQEDVSRPDPDRAVCRWALPDHRPARHGQDADGAHHCGDAGPDVPAHPVHAGPDALRHYRHGHY